MKACRWLDHDEARYGDACTLVTRPDGVRYWERKPQWLTYPGAPRDVQFCGQGRGRINSILACYTGEMRCYDPGPPAGGREA